MNGIKVLRDAGWPKRCISFVINFIINFDFFNLRLPYGYWKKKCLAERI